jgi:CubicO group peptidase (beta-lactamase class C family)
MSKTQVSLFLFLALAGSFETAKAGWEIAGEIKPIEAQAPINRTLISVVNSAQKFSDFEATVTTPMGYSGKTFSELVNTYKVNGLGIVIIEDGEITQERYYGYETKDKITPIDANTRFQAASMSKYIAGLTGAIAAEEGHITLGKKVSVMANNYPDSLLDEWRDKKFDGNEKSYPESITLKRLLNHSAGLDTHSIGTTPQFVNRTMDNILIGDGFFLTSDGVRPQNVPGVEYSYSGGGFIVAEHMLELATGRTYSDYATEKVLEAANMGKSTLEEIDEFTPDLAWGCSYDCSWKPEKTLVKAAGGLITTPKNYAKLLFPIMDWGLNQNGQELFSREVMENVMTPSFHKDSSKAVCTVDTDCPTVRYLNLGFTQVAYPVSEICFQNQCQELLMDGSGVNGLGVFMTGERLSDGFYRNIMHGGSHKGFRSKFRVDRKNRSGVVIMINGTNEVTLNNVTGYGSDGLINAIEKAYKIVYE